MTATINGTKFEAYRVKNSDFNGGVKKAKSLNGRFDADRKIWWIRPELAVNIREWDALEKVEAAAPAMNPKVCSVCGGPVRFDERYARPGYCGCEGE